MNIEISKPEFDPKEFVERAKKAGYDLGISFRGELYYYDPVSAYTYGTEMPDWFNESFKNKDTLKQYLTKIGKVEVLRFPTPEEMAEQWESIPVGRFRKNNFPTPNAEV